jgi:hypothetical protein
VRHFNVLASVPLEVLAPVITDDGDEEVGASGLCAWLTLVEIGPDEMACPRERSVESEQLEVV